MDGVITRLNVEEGSTAIVGTTNNPGSLLLTVADLSSMEAVVRVDETDLPDIQVGDSAIITIDAFPRQKFTGRVTEIGYSSVRSPLQQGAPTTGRVARPSTTRSSSRSTTRRHRCGRTCRSRPTS
jgi:multidrug resistance efflux pump